MHRQNSIWCNCNQIFQTKKKRWITHTACMELKKMSIHMNHSMHTKQVHRSFIFLRRKKVASIWVVRISVCVHRICRKFASKTHLWTTFNDQPDKISCPSRTLIIIQHTTNGLLFHTHIVKHMKEWAVLFMELLLCGMIFESYIPLRLMH